MEYRRRPFVSLSHLLQMAALSQRAVDYATKAYALQDSRFCLRLQDTEHSLHDLQGLVARRGRNLQSTGNTLDDDSVSGSCTLQIYSGLQITFAAAREIAHNALFLEEHRRLSGQSSLRWKQAASFANSLVTLNVVALFNRQLRFAEVVLQARQHPGWPSGPVNHARGQSTRQTDAIAAFEECVLQCLKEIADQAFDIACAIVRWLRSENCVVNSAELAGPPRLAESQKESILLSELDPSSLCAPVMKSGPGLSQLSG